MPRKASLSYDTWLTWDLPEDIDEDEDEGPAPPPEDYDEVVRAARSDDDY